MRPEPTRAEGNPVPRRDTRPLSACQAPDRLGRRARYNSPGRGNDGGTTMVTPDPSRHHPVVAATQAQRTADLQLRIADWISGFAGSMWFVYIHVALFSLWMLFIEAKPWPTLTLIVSLEAIFLSTFVMIGQNRQADFQQAKADHDFTEQELELKTNTELTREIHRLTTELHRRVIGDPA